MNLILIYFAIKYKGCFNDIFNALKNKEYVSLNEINNIKNKLKNKEIQAITIIDDDYPEILKKIFNPPFVIFYKGNKDILKNKIILLTGDYENDHINEFVNNSLMEITKNHILITNNFKGIDNNVVDFAQKNNKKIVMVSANGVDEPYVLSKNFNSDNTLIISEFPSGVNLNKNRLIQRNKLTMGLAEFLIIASSHKNSGIINLITHSLDQGKEIYCYPGLQNNDDGNNTLIKEGATMITSIKDTQLN